MADRGAIGYLASLPTTVRTQAVGPTVTAAGGGLSGSAPSGFVFPSGSNKVIFTTGIYDAVTAQNYAVSGTVSVLGVLTSGYVVRAFRRDNGALLGQTVSKAGGVFSIPIYSYNGEVTVVAYDDTGASPDFNAVVFDRVIPV